MVETKEKSIFDNYPDVLEPKHIREILRCGEKQIYELLNQTPPPFHYVKVGNRYKISKEVFRKWFEGDV